VSRSAATGSLSNRLKYPLASHDSGVRETLEKQARVVAIGILGIRPLFKLGGGPSSVVQYSPDQYRGNMHCQDNIRHRDAPVDRESRSSVSYLAWP
jgi:hypothetical protein